MVAVLSYRRARSGKTVHRSDCKVATDSNSLPWTYADGLTPDALVLVLANHPWLRPCRKCDPDRDS